MIVMIDDFPNKGLSGGCALWCGNCLMIGGNSVGKFPDSGSVHTQYEIM